MGPWQCNISFVFHYTFDFIKIFHHGLYVFLYYKRILENSLNILKIFLYLLVITFIWYYNALKYSFHHQISRLKIIHFQLNYIFSSCSMSFYENRLFYALNSLWVFLHSKIISVKKSSL